DNAKLHAIMCPSATLNAILAKFVA
ncbi:MAG: hypothetical protein RIS04_291, partial [Pseudomonadota bacterium]